MVWSSEILFFLGRYVLLLGAFAFVAYAYAYFRDAARRDHARLFEQSDLILGQMHLLAESVRVLEDRFDGRLHQLARGVEQQARVTTASTAQTSRHYETAIRLARTGVSRDELMESCGITRNEADLLVRLHGPRNSVPAATPTTTARVVPLR